MEVRERSFSVFGDDTLLKEYKTKRAAVHFAQMKIREGLYQDVVVTTFTIEVPRLRKKRKQTGRYE